MKNRYAIVTLLLSLVFFTTSCKQNRVEGKGNIETKSREIASFTGIHVQTPITVNINIQAGAAPSITLKGYPNVLEIIKTEVEGSELRIYTDDMVHLGYNEDVTAEITVPSIEALKISGAADASMKGMLNTSKFNLVISGAGDVKMDGINAETFSATLSGAGDLEVGGGSVNKLTYAVTGAGEISSFPLQCKEATVAVTGIGDVTISVSDKLHASVTGAGDIKYKGHPQLTKNITGAGSVEEDK